MKHIGMARLGREAEMRALNDGTPVLNLALAVNYGKKGQDGNRPTQWIEAAMFGQRAETLFPFMLKGSAHCFTLSDMHIEAYAKSDGSQGVKLAARVDDVELGPRQDGAAPPRQRQAPAQQQGDYRASAPRQEPAPRPAMPPKSSSGFDDMDSDIPF